MSDTQLASMRSGSVASMMDILGDRRANWGKNIFILDGQTGDFLDHIHRDNVVYNRHKQSLPDHLEMFEMTVVGDRRYAVHLGNDNKLIVPGEDGDLLEFRIFEVGKYRKDDTLTIEVFSRATYLDLLTARVFDPMQTDPLTAQEHAEQALFNTGWQVGDVDFSGVRTLTFDNPFNPYDYLRRITREFELEPRFYVMTDGQRVTGRYVDLVDRIGEWRGRTVEFGFDLQGIRRTEKTENIVTALYGYGPEREDGTRLKVFVEDLDALQRWGRDGRHIVDIYEPQTEDENMTEERLTTLTQAELNKRINAAVEYEADIVDLENVPGMENKVIRFADTIRIKDKKFNPALYVEARVHTQERDVFTRANKRVELGDFVEYTQEEVQAIWKQLQEQIRQKISRADLVEYAERKVQRDTIPPENTEHLWLDTSTEPNVLKRYDEAKSDWVKATPTEADEVGAETPEGAQDKADEAEENAKDYTDQEIAPINSRLTAAEDAITQAEQDLADAEQAIQDAQDVLDTITVEEGNELAIYGKIITTELVSENAVITGTFVGANAVFQNVSVENAIITGELAGVTGTFAGTLTGAEIIGSEFVSEGGNTRMRLRDSSITFENIDPVTEFDGTYTYETEFTNNLLGIHRIPTIGGSAKSLTVELGKIMSGSLAYGSGFSLEPDNFTMTVDDGFESNTFAISLVDGAAISYNGNIAVYPDGGSFDVAGNLNVLDSSINIDVKGQYRTLLRFDMERAWEFRQRGSGGQTALALRSMVDTKQFVIEDNSGGRIMRVQASTTNPWVDIRGDFNVEGSKSAKVSTENYGYRLMYAVESPDNRFMDVIEASLDPGEHWVNLNPMFAETINGYSVLPIAQDGGKVRILERETDRFKVRVSDETAEVAFWVYGRRKGYEEEYMRKIIEEGVDADEH